MSLISELSDAAGKKGPKVRFDFTINLPTAFTLVTLIMSMTWGFARAQDRLDQTSQDQTTLTANINQLTANMNQLTTATALLQQAIQNDQRRLEALEAKKQ